MHEVSIPSVGFAMTEGLLVRWLKQPGDPVAVGDAVAEIETDKTNAELESPAAGVLGRHRFEVGAAVPVGVPLVMILEVGEAEDGLDPLPAAAASANVSGDGRTDPVTPQAIAVEHERPRHRRSPHARATASQQESMVAAVPDGVTDQLPAAGHQPSGDAETPEAQALGWLRRMLLIREFEARCEPLSLAGKILGGVHSSLGQEAVAVGVAMALRDGDHAAGTHRSHHHALAMGIPPTVLMAELFGKATGSNSGRGGSMHVADLRRGFLGGNGIVGAGVGLAMGAALSSKVRGDGSVAVGYVGDGGANTGRTWEAVNLAVVWDLPLVIVCENNLYAVETATAAVTASESIAARAEGFGIRTVIVDGQDIVDGPSRRRRGPRGRQQGRGPTFIEARTYRYDGPQHRAGHHLSNPGRGGGVARPTRPDRAPAGDLDRPRRVG